MATLALRKMSNVSFMKSTQRTITTSFIRVKELWQISRC